MQYDYIMLIFASFQISIFSLVVHLLQLIGSKLPTKYFIINSYHKFYLIGFVIFACAFLRKRLQ